MLSELENPPEGTISDASYMESKLIVSSWDKHLKFYDTARNKLLKAEKTDTPILAHVIVKDKVIFGGLNKILYAYDPNKDVHLKLYEHRSSINNISFQPSTNFLFVADWSNGISVFDERTKDGLIFEITNFGFIHSIDVNESKLLVCDNLRRTYIFDTQNGISGFSSPSYKDNILRYQLRCIKAFPNQKGFVLSSIEGRVSWEYFDSETDLLSKKYTFKCHRHKKGDSEIAYPINSMDFHPKCGTFCTGGSDGIMCVWDGINKKRIWRTPNLKNEITKVKFNDAGDELCICVSSYLKKTGENSSTSSGINAVFVRKVTESEMKTC